MKLRPIERATIVRLAWQAECAAQDDATHLVNSYPMPTGDEANALPETVSECAHLGRGLLRAHLETVRGGK